MERVGVQFGADDAAKYFSTLDKVNKVTDILVGTTADLVSVLGLLEREEGKAGKGAKGLGEGVEQSSKKLSLLEQATIGATRRLGEFAVDGARMAGQAVLNFAKDGVRAAGDFESGMNSFQAVVGDGLAESGQSVDDFKQLFISLGRDLPVSTQEVQQAAIEMAKGGIEPATIAAGGLRQTLQFAAAGGLDLADAATIAAKTVAGWADVGATAAEKAALLAHATDLIARAANASTVNVDELALGLYNVQGAARASGVPLDETVTTLALLAPSFNSSAEAGNAMKNMLLRLQPATAPAADEMKRLSLLTNEGNSVFYDAEGHFIGMRATAAKLEKALGGLSEAEKTQALRTIFGNDALNAANTLLLQGADGYDAMADSMAKQLGVAEQARLKQQGFNTAVDNLMGSLEAFQITVFSRALPALTSLVDLLARGINAITDYAEATAQGETVLASIINVITTGALPALYGLTAALTAYAIVQVVQATPALLAWVAQLGLATPAILANAAAVAAAAAPYVLIAAAVGGVVYAWTDFNEKVTTATDEMLATKQFWTDSATAIEGLGQASEETQQRLQPLADSISMQRDLLHEQIESLGKRMAAGEVTDAQYASEMERLNGLATAITFASDQLNAQIDAEARAATASMTATTEAANLEGATAELGGQASLTAKDIEDLGAKIQDTYQKGQEAVQSYATNQSTFLRGVEERQQAHADQIAKLEAQKAKATTGEQKKGIDEQIAQAEQGYRDQEAKAAESYARQQAEQQAHLGQMLIDYTVAQASLGNISKDKAAEITGAIAKQYGLQETDTSSTFLKMAGIVDTWSKDTAADTDTYIQKLKDTQQQAADTQAAEDQYYQDSAAAAAASFTDKGGDVKTYISDLEQIPLSKSTAIELPEIDDRYQEIEGIDEGLRRIPTNIRIRISVQDEVPPEYKPGSPTPFELGIRGITRALGELSQTGIVLPKIGAEVGAVADDLSQLISRSDLPDDAEDLGQDTLQGFVSGLEGEMRSVRRTIGNIVDDVEEQFRNDLDIHSPPPWAIGLGEDTMLGVLMGLDGMLPDLLGTVQSITSMMSIGMDKLTDEMRKDLEERLAAIADTVGELPDLIGDALADSYGSLADIIRQQSDTLQLAFDIGRDPGDIARLQEQQAQLTEKGETLDAAIGEKQQRLDDISAGRLLVNDADRLKLAQELAELEQQRADIGDQFARSQQAQLDAAYQQEQRLALQQRTREELTQAQSEAGAMADPAKAAAFLKMRAEQIARITDLEQRRLAATDPAEQALLETQIGLERKAQEVDLAAFDLRKDEIGVMEDLIGALQTLNDNLDLGEADTPPALTALYQFLVRLTGMADGGMMQAMHPYIVGERGPELVVPDRTSTILDTMDTRRALAPPNVGGSVSNVYGGSTVVNVDARGSNLSEAQITQAVWAGISAASAGADVRIRMGVA